MTRVRSFLANQLSGLFSAITTRSVLLILVLMFWATCSVEGEETPKLSITATKSGGDNLNRTSVEEQVWGQFTDGVTVQHSVDLNQEYTFTYGGDPNENEEKTGSVGWTVEFFLGDGEDREENEEHGNISGTCGKQYVIEKLIPDFGWQEQGTSTTIAGSWIQAEQRWDPLSDTIRVVEKSDTSNNNPGEDDPSGGNCNGCGNGNRTAGGLNPLQKSMNLLSVTPPNMEPWVHIRYGLGRNSAGKAVGTIFFRKELSNFSMPTRADFEFIQNYPEALAVPDSVDGELRQVYGPEGLAHFIDLPGGGVKLEFYAPGSVSTTPDGDYYTYTGQPFAEYWFEQGLDGSVEGLLYKKTKNSETTITGYYGWGTPEGYVYRRVNAGGTIDQEVASLTVNVDDSWNRVLENSLLRVENGNEIELSVRVEEYASRDWGEVLERVIVDPDGDALTTEYAYYDDAQTDGSAYSRVKHIINPNGSWEKYAYERGRKWKVYRPWKDLPSVPGDATDSNCHLTTYYYDNLGQQAGWTEHIANKNTKWVATTQREWTSENDGSVNRNLLTDTETVFDVNNSGNFLISSTSYIRNASVGNPTRGALYRVVHPSEKASRYIEEKGNFTEGSENSGDFVVNPSGSFTRRIETEGSLSFLKGVDRKTRQIVTISSPKGVHLSETRICTVDNNVFSYEKATVTTYQYEAGIGGRLLSVKKDGQFVSSTAYSGTVRTETDAFGTITTNTFDAAGELLTSVKAGVPANSAYEAQADITTAYTQSGLTSTTTTTAGTLSLSSSTASDLAGRIVSRTDEQGRTTGINYTNGGRELHESSPGGVNRTESYYLDGQLKSITGDGVIPEFHDYVVDQTTGNITNITYYGPDGVNSSRWLKRVINSLGQLVREETPGPNVPAIVTEYVYNIYNDLIKASRTGFADIIYQYNDFGDLEYSGQDMNANGILDLASTDPIVEHGKEFLEENEEWWAVEKRARYLDDNSDDEKAITINKRKMRGTDGVVKINIGPEGNAVKNVTSIDRTARMVTSTTTHPLSELGATEMYRNGLLVAQNSMTVSSSVLMRYDALGRLVQQIDPRSNQPTSITYDTEGQVSSFTDGVGNVMSYTYYGNTHANAGLISSQSNEEGEVSRFAYDKLGRLTHQWGNSVHPKSYVYGTNGEMTQLKTFQSAGDWNNVDLPTSFDVATPSVTIWGHDPGSGLLIAKTDAAGEAVEYTYYDSGLTHTRTWARGTVTTYTYDGAGRTTGVNYSDTTPDILHTYRRDGQRLTSSDVAGLHVYAYRGGTGVLAGETISGGILGGLAINWSEDVGQRTDGYSVTFNTNLLASASYNYDSTSRLKKVTSGVLAAEYNYVANSDLLHTTTLMNNTVVKLIGTRHYDNADRLTPINWVNNVGTVVSSHAYQHDGESRRTRADITDGSHWIYEYSDKGEVTSAVKKASNGVKYPGLAHGYTFDEIGNRLTSIVDAEGGGDRTTSYHPNHLNQYASIDAPLAFDVTGVAASNAIVKINHNAAQRQGSYFRKEIATAGNETPVWVPVEVEVTLPGAGIGGERDIVTSREGYYFMPPSPISVIHDEDGNLVADGRWSYVWDAENRLVGMETLMSAVIAGVPQAKLVFDYDGASRRVKKRVYKWDGTQSDWVLAYDNRFIYLRHNLVAEINDQGSLLRSHVWGTDFSQTMDGVGGVGGLLWSHDHSKNNSYYAAHDGAGNITALVDASTSSVITRYDYSPYGENVLTEHSSVINSNPFRYSSKYLDEETGLLYYGFRYYDSLSGRWLSREPLGEEASLNLYGFVNNQSINFVDYLGLDPTLITLWPTVTSAGAGSSGGAAGAAATGIASAPAGVLGAAAIGTAGATALLGSAASDLALSRLARNALRPRNRPVPGAIQSPSLPRPILDPQKRSQCDAIQAAKDQAKGDHKKASDKKNNASSSDFCDALTDLMNKVQDMVDLRQEWKDLDCDSDSLGWNDGKTEAKRRAGHDQQLNDLRGNIKNLRDEFTEKCICPMVF